MRYVYHPGVAGWCEIRNGEVGNQRHGIHPICYYGRNRISISITAGKAGNANQPLGDYIDENAGTRAVNGPMPEATVNSQTR
jgi:hypothetical protein